MFSGEPENTGSTLYSEMLTLSFCRLTVDQEKEEQVSIAYHPTEDYPGKCHYLTCANNL